MLLTIQQVMAFHSRFTGLHHCRHSSYSEWLKVVPHVERWALV